MLAKKLLLYSWLILTVSFTSCSKETVNPVTPYNPPPAVKDTTFTNPLLPSGPDPWVIKKDSFYYYTHTLGNRITLWKTKTVSELSSAENKIVWAPTASGSHSHNIWAPE